MTSETVRMLRDFALPETILRISGYVESLEVKLHTVGLGWIKLFIFLHSGS